MNWSINLDGGLVLLGKESSGSIASIPAGGETEVTSDPIIGLGPTTILVTAEILESTATKEAESTILLFFILIKPGGG